MGDYSNLKGANPIERSPDLPGIYLPNDFALEAADRGLAPKDTKTQHVAQVASKTEDMPLSSRKPDDYGEAIARLTGASSGPGFDVIFRPHSAKNKDHVLKLPNPLPDDDLLEFNLTHELWTFPPIDADLGLMPNRVAGSLAEDVFLRGIPYTQIVKNVTDTKATSGTRIPVTMLGKAIDINQQENVQDIHFEPGLFIHVPSSAPVSTEATITRMASIPHGTTINAQGKKAVKTDGAAPPNIPFSATATQPFQTRNGSRVAFKNHFDLNNDKATRLPQDMKPFNTNKTQVESITAAMVQDPNDLLIQHNKGRTFSQTIQFTVSTVPNGPIENQACPHLAARDAMTKTNAALANLESRLSHCPQIKPQTKPSRPSFRMQELQLSRP